MGLIYMRISPSGGKYIGKTIHTEIHRWNDHVYEAYHSNSESYNSLLNKAIRKYGSDSFTVQILEEHIPDFLLNEREKYWIAFYKTYYKDNNHGYNMTLGGDGNSKYDIKLLLDFWNQGFSLKEISEKLSIRRQTISTYLHNEGISEEEIINRGIVQQRKSSLSFSLTEAKELWDQGYTIQQIGEKLKVKGIRISFALKDFYNISPILIQERAQEIRSNKKKKRIYQYNLNNQLIKVWDSIIEASEELGISKTAISYNLSGKTKTCCKSYFKREKDVKK